MRPAGKQREVWRGVFCATVTPLTEDERLDEGALEDLAQRLLDEGQKGLYVAGTTGEGYGIDDEVRIAAYKGAARVAAGRRKGEFVIAHVGGVHTRRAAALARAAEQAGCHAISALPPYGGRYSYEELTAYYRSLAQATGLPLVVYYIPAVSGYDFSREQLSRWLELPNVLGMKYTSFDMFRLERLLALHPGKVFFSGYDESLMAGLTTGARSAIGATYNVTGPVALKVAAAVERGDLTNARRAQGALNAFIEEMLAPGVTWFRGFKALVAQRMGWTTGRTPEPGLTPAPEACSRMRLALDGALEIARQLP